MIAALDLTLLGVGLALALWTGIRAYRRRSATSAQVIAAGVLLLALLVQSVIALFRVAGASLAEPVTFIAYAIGILIPLPVGIWVARVERTRWGTTALCFTAVVAAVMTLRLHQLWSVRV